MALNTNEIRKQFPFLKNKTIYFDTASSSQKPESVITKLTDFYYNSYANTHRGAYTLADKASLAFESARKTIAEHVGANAREIIFTKNTTEAINLLAQSIAKSGKLNKGDKILLSIAEHHSNITPWLQIADEYELEVKYIDIDPTTATLNTNNLDELLKDVKIVSINHISNILGYTNDIKALTQQIKAINPNCLVIIDGCQATPNQKINVSDMNCDFYAFSSHKMYGPSGAGALFGKLELLKELPSFITGGGMVHEVFTDHFKAGEVPHKFEAGTAAIAEVVAFAESCKFLSAIGFEAIHSHEKELTQYCLKQLQDIPEIQVVSNKDATSIIAINCKTTSNFNIADALADKDICVRVGHHCCQPLIDRLNYKNLLRISFGIYNTKEEVDILITTIKEAIQELS